MAERSPNTRLRERIAESGSTYEAIAADVRRVAAEAKVVLRTNKSTVEHWIGGTVPAGETGRYLAEALSRRLGRLVTEEDCGLRSSTDTEHDSIGLSLSVDPIRDLSSLWRGDLERRRFLSSAAYSVAASLPLSHVQETAGRAAAVRSGAVAGMTDVEAVRDMVRCFSEMDERHGGQHGRSALVQYLRSDVAALCRGRFRTDEVRRQMLSAAGRGVHLAGWKAYDAGEQGLAQRYYLQSFAMATESDVVGHDGFVMRTMAMQGLKLHRPEHCLALAETGVNRAKGKVDAQTEALFRIVHAHTLAKAGHRHPALSEAQRAHDLLEESCGDEVPFWGLTWGPPTASVHSRAAKVFETLGEHRASAEQYRRAAASRPAGTYARIVALDLVAEAEMHLKQGGIERACATWHEAIDHMNGVASARTRKAVTTMRRDLRPFRARGLRAAAELDERASTYLRSR